MAKRYEIAEVVQAPGTTNPYLRAVAGRSVTINDLRGQPLTVYSTEGGVGTIPQPLATDANGRIEGWVEAPDFDIVVAGPNGYTQPVRQTTRGIHMASYGVKADDATDNLLPLQAVIAALPANGGELIAPAGIVRYSGQLNFDTKRSVKIRGEAGLSAGAAQASILKFTGNGAGSAISARSTKGLVIEDVALSYSDPAFTGILLDLSNNLGGANDTAYFEISRVLFEGQRTATLVSLNRAISGGFTSCVFHKGAPAVRGRNTAADYSNAIGFVNCRFFENLDTAGQVRNAGQGWGFINCTFEQLYTAAGASAGAGAYAYDAGIDAIGLTFLVCWFGDANGTGTWVDFSGNGLSVIGGEMGGGALGIKLPTAHSCRGIDILGVNFDGVTTAFDYGQNNRQIFFMANEFTGVTTMFTGLDDPPASILSDQTKLSLRGALDVKGGNVNPYANIVMQGATSQIVNRLQGGSGNQILLARSAAAANDLLAIQADGKYSTGPGNVGVDTHLERAQAAVWKMTSALQLVAIAAGSVPNNTVFIDSADNKLKFKDSGGVVNLLY